MVPWCLLGTNAASRLQPTCADSPGAYSASLKERAYDASVGPAAEAGPTLAVFVVRRVGVGGFRDESLPLVADGLLEAQVQRRAPPFPAEAALDAILEEHILVGTAES